MKILDTITEKSVVYDLAKALQGQYGSEITEQYWSVTICHISITQALTDCTISLKEHPDFYHNGQMIPSAQNKIKLKKGETLIYYIK